MYPLYVISLMRSSSPCSLSHMTVLKTFIYLVLIAYSPVICKGSPQELLTRLNYTHRSNTSQSNRDIKNARPPFEACWKDERKCVRVCEVQEHV